jgi:hypothetical protein
MSVRGQQRTLRSFTAMFALPSRADIGLRLMGTCQAALDDLDGFFSVHRCANVTASANDDRFAVLSWATRKALAYRLGSMMKKFLCSVIGCFLIAVAAPAGAADLPLPASVLAGAPSWTGFYVGAGFGFRSSDTNVNVTSASTTVGALGPFNLIAGAGCNAGVPCVLGGPFNGTSFRFAPYLG